MHRNPARDVPADNPLPFSLLGDKATNEFGEQQEIESQGSGVNRMQLPRISEFDGVVKNRNETTKDDGQKQSRVVRFHKVSRHDFPPKAFENAKHYLPR